MAGNMLDENGMAALAALLEEADAANPEPMEEETEMEEAQDTDEVDAANEAVDELGEGEGEVSEEEAEPDPNAAAEAPAAPALPEGIESVEQLVQEFNNLRAQADQRGSEMETLRELNEQLVSIAQVLGYSKDIESVDLSVKDDDPNSQMRAMISEQFKPLIEQQQKTLRGKMIDNAWKKFGAENSDVSEMMDDIKEVLKGSPDLYDDENGLAVAYHMARSGKYKPEKALFEDDAFVERAAQNEKVKEKVIADYLKKVKKSGAEAPASVGKGGSAAAMGKKKPAKNMEEAHKEARKLFG